MGTPPYRNTSVPRVRASSIAFSKVSPRPISAAGNLEQAFRRIVQLVANSRTRTFRLFAAEFPSDDAECSFPTLRKLFRSRRAAVFISTFVLNGEQPPQLRSLSTSRKSFQIRSRTVGRSFENETLATEASRVVMASRTSTSPESKVPSF